MENDISPDMATTVRPHLPVIAATPSTSTTTSMASAMSPAAATTGTAAAAHRSIRIHPPQTGGRLPACLADSYVNNHYK